MNAIIAVALLTAGLALVVGARETAKKIGLGVLGAIIGLGLARCLVCWLTGAQETPGPASTASWFWPVVVLVFLAVGAAAWNTRAFRQRRLDDLRRKRMHPRRPAPLPPPNPLSDHNEDLL